MKIDFQSYQRLLKRIDIHSQFGARDIDGWMLNVLQLQRHKILTSAAARANSASPSTSTWMAGGSAARTFRIAPRKPRRKRKRRGCEVQLLDFNQPLPPATPDLISACFVYYARYPFTLAECGF